MSKSTAAVIQKLEELTDGDKLFWQQGRLTLKMQNGISKHTYQGLNAFTLSLTASFRRYTSPYWATYKQITENGGRLVDAKGAGVPILFYSQVPDKRDPDGERTFPLVRHSFVFNLDLVEGLTVSLPANNELDTNTDAESHIRAYIKSQGIIEKTTLATPSYSPSIDRISMPPKSTYETTEAWYGDLFHEVGHSTGHKNRLSRPGITCTNYSHTLYSAEELVAEIFAVMMSEDCGLTTDAQLRNSAAYLQGWRSFIKSDPAAVASAITHASRAREYFYECQGKSITSNEAA